MIATVFAAAGWRHGMLAAALALAPSAFGAAVGQPAAGEIAVGPGVAELRHVVGEWDVRTEFLNPDGSVARAVNGSYAFEWVVPDAIVRGIARQPEMNSVSAVLLYVRPAARQIEMVSVDQNGVRWVMTGEEGSDVRATADRTMSDGSRLRLRFTRFAIAPDRFESRMDFSADGGATWTQGNRQVFLRRPAAAGAGARL